MMIPDIQSPRTLQPDPPLAAGRAAKVPWRAVLVALIGMGGLSGLSAQDLDPPDGDGMLRLQFPNNPISDLLGIYELLTGKAIVTDSEVFDGPSISLVTARQVTREEGIKLIEATLQANGYVIVPSPDGVSVRVLDNDADLSVINEDVELHHSASTLPEGRAVASYFMQLDPLDPVEASTLFYGHVGLSAYGRLTPVASPRGLLITDNSALIRQFIKLQSILDVPGSLPAMETSFYDLEHANATVVARLLAATFQTRERPLAVPADTLGAGRSRRPQAAAPETHAPKIAADDRLNRVMVVAIPSDQEYVRVMVQEFDQPILSPEPFERKLEYVFVDEVLPVLVDVLQDTGTGVSLLPDGETLQARAPPAASSDASTLTGRTRQGVQRREGETTEVGGRQDQLLDPLQNTAPISVLVGKTRLIADLQANKLIAIGASEDLAKIESVLDRLDRRPPQVYLATIIGQLTLGDGIEFGVDYFSRLRETEHGSFAGSVLGNQGFFDDDIAQIIDPALGAAMAGAAGSFSGLTLFGRTEEADILLRALETTDRFKILSRPSIYASNNKKAVIASGQRIPVPESSIQDLSNNSSVRTNVRFEDVVLKLEVIPLINSDHEVSLTIAQINDNVIGQQTVGGDSIPVIGTEQLTTTVTVPNGQTIVLGGLITEGEEENTRGVPFISRIPVLGHAFKSTSRSVTRKELLVFIQPIIVTNHQEQARASLSEDLRSSIGAEVYKTFPPAPVDLPPNPKQPATAPPK
ncbi:type II secretion system secretin GspD [soil metagenome]